MYHEFPTDTPSMNYISPNLMYHGPAALHFFSPSSSCTKVTWAAAASSLCDQNMFTMNKLECPLYCIWTMKLINRLSSMGQSNTNFRNCQTHCT